MTEKASRPAVNCYWRPFLCPRRTKEGVDRSESISTEWKAAEHTLQPETLRPRGRHTTSFPRFGHFQLKKSQVHLWTSHTAGHHWPVVTWWSLHWRFLLHVTGTGSGLRCARLPPDSGHSCFPSLGRSGSTRKTHGFWWNLWLIGRLR